MKNNSKANRPVEEPPSDDISDWETPCEYDRSIYECGLDSLGEEDMESVSKGSDSDWSVYQNSDSSIVRNDIGGRNHGSSLECEQKCSSSFDCQESNANVAKKSVFIRADGETIYGKLFEDPDPWRRIGIILGLEDEVQYPASDDMSIGVDVNHESPSLNRELRNDGDSAITVNDTEGTQSCEETVCLELGTEHKEDSTEVLAIPRLQEINGKFLAPSLSFEWESEEE